MLDAPPLPKPRAYHAGKPRTAKGSVLSAKQKMILAQLCGKAYPAAEKCGAVEADLMRHGGHTAESLRGLGKTAKATEWRHLQVRLVTGRVDSLKQAQQSEYRPLLAHFEKLAGESGRAFDTTLRDIKDAACHRAPGCEWVRDMAHWMAKAGFSEEYAAVIIRAKFRRPSGDVRELTEAQLKQLHDTIVNRARAKLGLGKTEDRNKRQRCGEGDEVGQD